MRLVTALVSTAIEVSWILITLALAGCAHHHVTLEEYAVGEWRGDWTGDGAPKQLVAKNGEAFPVHALLTCESMPWEIDVPAHGEFRAFFQVLNKDQNARSCSIVAVGRVGHPMHWLRK